jgi:hypothetical protein
MDISGQQRNLLYRKHGNMLLIVGMKMGRVMSLGWLDKHANDDAIKSRNLRHAKTLSPSKHSSKGKVGPTLELSRAGPRHIPERPSLASSGQAEAQRRPRVLTRNESSMNPYRKKTKGPALLPPARRVRPRLHVITIANPSNKAMPAKMVALIAAARDSVRHDHPHQTTAARAKQCAAITNLDIVAKSSGRTDSGISR